MYQALSKMVTPCARHASAEYGRNLHLWGLENPRVIVLIINPTARISSLADIEDSVRGSRIEVGPNTVIDSFVKIKPTGGAGDIVIGASTHINSGTVLYSGNGIRIGNNVLIAANCTLAPTNHEYRDGRKLIAEQGFLPSRGGIVIEDDVWIGANSVLLDGAKVGQGAIVAAGSIVRGAVAPYTVVAGSKLRVVARRTVAS